MAKPKPKATTKPRAVARPKARTKRGNAARVLLAAVGKPRNINTVAVDALPCVKQWLTLADVERVQVVRELAGALDAMRGTPDWEDVHDSAWNIKYAFTKMVALGKALDRLLRARLPLDEATLTTLCKIVVERHDFSVLRLTAQLEHYGASQPVGPDLRAAMLAINERYSWGDYDRMRARIGWLAAPSQPERIAGLVGAT